MYSIHFAIYSAILDAVFDRWVSVISHEYYDYLGLNLPEVVIITRCGRNYPLKVIIISITGRNFNHPRS